MENTEKTYLKTNKGKSVLETLDILKIIHMMQELIKSNF